jgi:anti-sigma B factor antagonist
MISSGSGTVARPFENGDAALVKPHHLLRLLYGAEDGPAEQAHEKARGNASQSRDKEAPTRDVERASDRFDALSDEEKPQMPSRKVPGWLGTNGEAGGTQDGDATGNGAAVARNRAEAGRELIAGNQASSDGVRHSASACAGEVAGLEPFAVEVQWRDDLAIVQPSGELDVATVETLRAALNGVKGAGRLVLDLRGLSFIDSTGLHLLVALHERARNDGFQLTLLAPAAPVDRAIRLCGLDEALPIAAAGDGADRQRESLHADRGSGG